MLTPAWAPLNAARNLYPRLYQRFPEILRKLGASGLMATPTEADVTGPAAADIDTYLQAATLPGAERVRLFRLAWDTCISAFAGRQALYEYYFFGNPVRMAGAYVGKLRQDPVRRPASGISCGGDDRMCRWLAYTGAPIPLSEVLYTPVHSLIDQSLHSRLGAETTNGDGFGVGWYDAAAAPGVFRSIEPAWNDLNLRELAGHVSSHLFFAHVRAAIGSAVQQTNCHPFRHGRWLFMHNGFIDGFAAIKRDLVLAVDESLYPEIQGTSDTEVLFYLALTFGLQDDPPEAVARAIGFVEARGRGRGVEYPFQGTLATSDGETLWAFRYSSQGKSRSLFYTRDIRTLRREYPGREILREVPTTRGSWSPSRSATCPAHGRKCPRRPMPWSARARTSCSPSALNKPNPLPRPDPDNSKKPWLGAGILGPRRLRNRHPFYLGPACRNRNTGLQGGGRAPGVNMRPDINLSRHSSACAMRRGCGSLIGCPFGRMAPERTPNDGRQPSRYPGRYLTSLRGAGNSVAAGRPGQETWKERFAKPIQ